VFSRGLFDPRPAPSDLSPSKRGSPRKLFGELEDTKLDKGTAHQSMAIDVKIPWLPCGRHLALLGL
jgi:hypothetical protein